MLFISSIFAVMTSVLMYCKHRESCPFIIQRIINEVKYFILGIKEAFNDWKDAKYNKNNDCPPQKGRVAIVTGGSRGIGVDVVKMLLELDMEVIIACRTPAAGDETIFRIRESGVKSGVAKVYKLDNSSLKSVKQFATQIKKDYKQIHVLINNAGVMFCPYHETEDGFEQQWAVNYLSHFLLSALLLPLLKAGGHPQQSSRIVNVSSCAHLLGKINFNDINNKNGFISGQAYAQSKLAQEISTKILQNLLKEKKYHVQVYSVHPGIILTDLFIHTALWRFKFLFQRILKSSKEGATPIVYAAVNKAIENYGGIYISNCRPTPSHPDALDLSIQKQLLNVSLQQVQLNDFFQYIE
ncbi:retinol dehydrogenase 12-like [Hylaeus anthracinus]|uniref:retinol dehydrogenase 12-like n=1 Tax=Hylaeus anthracinus TaxID=313031 RepID=UPI0023B92429|nr:retinol dehydrogenase 12-like [Hylaeus anthracinus]